MRTLRLLLSTMAVTFILTLSALAQPASSAMHIVLPGETLGIIAQRYSVNLHELAALNGIYNTHLIFTWQELQLPSSISSAASTAEARGTHIVQLGETLDSIAAAYGIELFELQAMNGIFNAWIYPGDELKLPFLHRTPTLPPEIFTVGSEPRSAAGPTHIVKAGETLGTIAASYSLSLFELQNLNDIWTWIIYPGQEIQLPAGATLAPVEDSPAPVEEFSPPAEESPASIALPDSHTVQRGETLFGIAQQYDVALDALMAANAIADPRRIHSGLVLRVRDLVGYAPPAAAPPASAPPSNVSRSQYVVQPGDFLSQIGAKFGMNWLAITALNGISNPDTVHVGAVLQIPTAEEAARYGPVQATNFSSYHTGNNHPGAHIGVGRELVVVLNTQTAYAYENGVLQKRALISSGLPDTPTLQGNFKITRKLPSRHMVGPDYDLPGVPWVSYFYAGYAFHGTYWHNNFGTPMSHGCVNMTTADAKWFYDFAPVGTPVHVRYY